MSDWRPPSPSRGPDDHGEVPEGIDPVSGVPYSEGWRDRTVVESVRASLGLLTKRDRRLTVLAGIVQMSLGLLDLLGVALIGIVAAVAVSGIDPTSMSPTMQEWIDRLGLGDLTASQLVGLIALVAVLLLVTKTLVSAFLTRRMMRFLANRQADVSARLARTLLSRPLLDVQRWSTAEVLYALTSGVGAAVTSLLGASLIIVSELFLFTVMAVGLFLVDPTLTLATAAYFAIIVYILQVWLGRASARNSTVQADRGMSTITTVSEALTTYRETTVLNRRDFYIDRFDRMVRDSAQAGAANAYYQEIPKYVLETALVLGGFALAIVQFVTKDLAAAAAIIGVFLAAGFRITPSMLRLQGAAVTIRSASAAARKTFELASWFGLTEGAGERPQRISDKQARAIRDRIAAGHGDFEARIDVEGVTITYPGADRPALLDASAHVEPGHSLALVGSTGAGKSTLADVILGVLDLDAGSVLISGVTPREATQRWPGAIAYVPQSVGLTEGTIRENVALGLPDIAIDDDMVWDALERAHLAEFLRETREGLDTVVGERGVRLSGGQRQRLGIARALYTRPRLLVLDEATSALDAETEQSITKTLQDLEGEVTTVTIAHRLATIRHADEVLFLREGVIVARGTFDEVRASTPDFDRSARLLGM
jgi:ABC-type multidrug transport system fused ATPase/permease subunit